MLNSNIIGSKAVFNFCLKNKIKLIYSATSASLGNKGLDKNLSCHLQNLKFRATRNLNLVYFRGEFIYFYNVYGQIKLKEHMATVLGSLKINMKINH